MDIRGIISAFGQGVIDSLSGLGALWNIDKEMNERSIRHSPNKTKSSSTKPSSNDSQKQIKQFEESNVLNRVLKVCLLNGCIFVCSIGLFHYGLLPGLRYVVAYFFQDTESRALTFWNWMERILSSVFNMVWVVPLFFLNKVINFIWFQDIADDSFRYFRGRPKIIPSISKLIADSLFSLLVQILFVVQSQLVAMIPIVYVTDIVYCVHLCLLYSLYAFEYRWFNMGWELHKRLTYIENNWPYFIGFGLPLALLTQLAPGDFFISGGLFSTCFPIFIISGNEADPKIIKCDYPLRLFSPVVAISNYIFSNSIGKGKVVESGPQRR